MDAYYQGPYIIDEKIADNVYKIRSNRNSVITDFDKLKTSHERKQTLRRSSRKTKELT